MREKYAGVIGQWMQVLKTLSAELSKDYLRTGQHVASDVSCDGMSMMLVLAATVELIEPDEQTPVVEHEQAEPGRGMP